MWSHHSGPQDCTNRADRCGSKRNDTMDSDSPEPEPTELLRDLDRFAQTHCRDGTHRLCGHEVVCSIALGFKNAPRCLPCLARGLAQPTTELRDRLAEHLQRRPCYWRAWTTASQREDRDERRPACLWPEGAGASLPRSDI